VNRITPVLVGGYCLTILIIIFLTAIISSAVIERILIDRHYQSIAAVLASFEDSLSQKTFPDPSLFKHISEKRGRVLLIGDEMKTLFTTDPEKAGLNVYASDAIRLGLPADSAPYILLQNDTLTIVKKAGKRPSEWLETSSLYAVVLYPEDDVAEVVRAVRINIGLIGALALLVMGGIATLIVVRVSSPIHEFTRTVNRIRSGALDLRFSENSSYEEIKSLSEELNALVERLRNDIGQLKRLERVRTEFLGNISHELRTPIFSMQGFIETLLDGAVDDPKVNRVFLKKAYAHAERLNNLLNDLIEISRIETREMKMSYQPFPIHELLDQVIRDYQPLADSLAVRLSLVSNLLATTVIGDRERIRQVLNNLVQNAIKYNRPKGSVTLRTFDRNNHVLISVEDTGVGIPEEHLSRIFERFYRVDKDRSRDVGGTGLGLAIVKHLVDAHGSTVEVTSEVNRGSTFSFQLRKPATGAPTARASGNDHRTV